MKKKLLIVILFSLTLIIFILGLIFLNKNQEIVKNNIEILDATYQCNEVLEKFYEDNSYIYYFPCVKSSSTYVKFKDNTKLLVTDALKEGKVTIDELIKAGLEVHKKHK